MDNEKDARKIICLLKSIGLHTEYKPCNFNDMNHEYATFEIESPQKFAEGLEKELHSYFNSQNGDETNIRFIATKSLENNRFRYIAEIYPDRRFNKAQLEGATNKFLHSLPKAIKNYLRKKENK